MEVKIGIYKITSPCGKIYIGQSVNVKKRFKRYHKMDCKGQPRLYNSFLKYGSINHIFEVLCICDIEELNIKERHYQNFYEAVGVNGLNCLLTETNSKRRVLNKETIEKQALSRKGMKQSEETIRKRVASMIGLKRSQECKDKMSLSAKGRKSSESTKKKIRDSLVGRICSEETKLKISKARIGFKHSEETKLKLSIISSNMSEEHRDKIRQSNLEKKTSEETKNKMSEAHKGKIFSEERKYNMRLNNAKKVFCLKTSIIYESISDCARKNNFKKTTLKAKLAGKNPNNTSFVYFDKLIHTV